VASTHRAVLVGILVWLFPVALLLVATDGIVPASPAPEGVADAGDGRTSGLFAAARSVGAAAPTSPSSDSWVHGLPLLPRLPAAPAPAAPTEEQTAPEELPPEQLAEVETAARAAVTLEARQAPAVRPSGRLGAAVPPAVRRWESLIVRSAERSHLDPNLIAALMMTESGGDPRAVSSRGAVGLLQVMGGSFDPEANVQQGAEILAGHLRRYGGRLDLALAAYNAGPASVDRYGGVPPFRETRDHVFRVLLRLDLYGSR